MRRPIQFIRFVGLFVLILAASRSSASSAVAFKGIRAVVFSGESLREPVRIHDSEYATTVWLRLRAGAALPDDSSAVVRGRRCVVISAFIFNEKNENVAVQDLPAGQGDYTYRMYLTGASDLPVVISNDRIWRLNSSIAEDLRTLGIPTTDTTRTATGCK